MPEGPSSLLPQPVSKGVHRWVCKLKGSAHIFAAVSEAIDTSPRGSGKIDYDSSFFAILFSSSNKGGDMGIWTQRFIMERAKYSPMMNLILEVSFYMFWVLASRGVAMYITGQVPKGAFKIHGETKTQVKGKLPIPVILGKQVNKI